MVLVTCSWLILIVAPPAEQPKGKTEKAAARSASEGAHYDLVLQDRC